MEESSAGQTGPITSHAEPPVNSIPVPTKPVTSKRPGHGLPTVLMVLNTGIAITLASIESTRWAALMIFLPVYAITTVAYLLFVCCVRDVDEDDDLQPNALRDYLSKKKRRSRRAEKKRRKKKLKEAKARSLEQAQAGQKGDVGGGAAGGNGNVCESDSFETDCMHAEGSFLSDEEDTIPTNGSSTRASPCADRTEIATVDDTFQDNPFEIGEIFSTLTNTIVQVESSLHHFTKDLSKDIRYRIAPPSYCYVDKDGVTRLKADETPRGPRSPSAKTRKTLFQRQPTPVARTRKSIVAHGGDIVTPPIKNLDLYCPPPPPPPPKSPTEDNSSPSPPEEINMSTDLELDDTVDEELQLGSSSYCNLTGKYKLVHNHNYDQFLKSQNVPMLLRKAACASRPIQTITHNGDTLRIQVDGITKGDTTFTINGPPSQSNIRHLKFDDYVTYVERGKAIQVRKEAKNAPQNGARELIITRRLAECGNNLLLASKARFKDGSCSVEAVQTYHRIE